MSRHRHFWQQARKSNLLRAFQLLPRIRRHLDKLAAADNNRVFFVDLIRKTEPITESPVPAELATSPKVDATQPERKVRTIVIDPGHGGIDSGAKGASISEKDLTLVLARKLRAVLQMRLGATVLLTRDSDIAMDNEARSAVANNNQANLFISLHAGFSANPTDAGSSGTGSGESSGAAGSRRRPSRNSSTWSTRARCTHTWR